MYPPRALPQGSELVDRIQSVLDSRSLTLRQVSQQSAALYGRSSPHFIPHNLYYNLRHGRFSPSLHQLFALSRISGYCLTSWLRSFGVAPEGVLRLQTLLPSKRTVLLDHSLDEDNAWVPWFRDAPKQMPQSAVVPLSQLLVPDDSRRVRSLLSKDRRRFAYARIGSQDAYAFPDLIPGSIVRIDLGHTNSRLPIAPGEITRHLYLIEHSRGFCCSRLESTHENCIIPVSQKLPFRQVRLRLRKEARLVGIADMEIRSMATGESPEVPRELAARWKPGPLRATNRSLGQLLQGARKRMALSFREASAMSRTIAESLGDERYFAAPGSLSDYEVLEKPPRHVHKVFTLCLVYGVPFSMFLAHSGLRVEEAGHDPFPDSLLSPRVRPQEPRSPIEHELQSSPGFLATLLEQWEEPPLFLRESLEALSGLHRPTLRDFFWIGGEHTVFHPCLKGGLLIIVNRQKKQPVHLLSAPCWQQPIYLIAMRNGEHVCACCSLEDGTLVLHRYSDTFQRLGDQFLSRGEAEIVGQIVTIARRLD